MAKRQLITDLDMSGIKADERGQAIDRLIGATTLYLEQHYPVAQGYRHKRREFKPYQKHPHVVGVHLAVQRGTIWGYTVSFKPLDLENQEVRVTLSTNPRLFDIVGFSALAPVFLLVVWVLATGRIKIDFNINVGAVLLSIFWLLGLWITFIGILWLPVRAVMSRKVDKEAQEREMDDLGVEIRNLLTAPTR